MIFTKEIEGKGWKLVERKGEILLERGKDVESISKLAKVEGKMIVGSLEKERVVIFVIKEGRDEGYRLDIFIPQEGGVAVDVSTYPLGFTLSRHFSAAALGKSLLIVDYENQRYVFLSPGYSLSNFLTISPPAFLFIVDEKRAAIVDAERIYVICGKKRALIIPIPSFSLLSPVFTYKRDGEYEWLVIEDDRSDIGIYISIGERDTFGYKYVELRKKSFQKMKGD